MRIRRIDGGWAFINQVRDERGVPVRVLRVGGAYQSATYLDERWWELPFEYYRAFDRLFDARSGVRGAGASREAEDAAGPSAAVPERALDVSSVLVIGGGGCSYPKHLVMGHAGVSVDVLERDRRIARIAREHFFVDRLERELRARGEEGRFRLIVADGMEYLRSCARSYDAVVNDAFVGRMPVRDFVEPCGLALIKEHLSPAGVYVTNFVVGDEASELVRFQESLEALQAAFASVQLVVATDDEYSDLDNYVVFASDGSHAFAGAIPL